MDEIANSYQSVDGVSDYGRFAWLIFEFCFIVNTEIDCNIGGVVGSIWWWYGNITLAITK
jgi:hypothetical protein